MHYFPLVFFVLYLLYFLMNIYKNSCCFYFIYLSIWQYLRQKQGMFLVIMIQYGLVLRWSWLPMCKYDNQFILCCVYECMRHQEHLHFLTKQQQKKAFELEKNLVEGKSLETLLQLWEALTFFIFKSIANGLQILILMSGQIAQSYVCPLLSNQHSPHKLHST